MPPKLSVVSVLCLAFLALLPLAQPVFAEEQCGSPVLRIEDLRTLARNAALANRIAPHSEMRSIYASLAGPERRKVEAATPLGSASAADEPAWQPGFGLPSLHEYAGAAIEYHGELVVSGWLRSAGQYRVNGIARWTTNGWQPLGDGIVPGFALAVWNDRLYAGDWIGGISAWDGQTWTRVPQAPLDRLQALLVHDGALVAAGGYSGRGRIARFDGQAWQFVGGEFDTYVDAIGSYRGELIAGGSFRSYAGAPCGYVARWDGTTWVSLGSGIDPTDYAGVKAIEEYGGRLIVGGWFSSCGAVATPGLASWDGSAWSALPGVAAAYVNDLLVMDGKLHVAGSFVGDFSSVASWDGTTWAGQGLGQWVLGLASFNGRLAAVGGFDQAGCPNPKRLLGVATLGPEGWDGLERWDGSMHGLAMNAGAADVASAVLYRGDLVVAGMIRLAGDPPGWKTLSNLARWDGQGWQPVGDGVTCPSMVDVVGDDLIAAGWLSGWSAEGAIVGVARWDGTAWYPMGRGLVGMVWAVAGFEGRVYAGGEFTIAATNQTTTLAMFDGVEWSEVPAAPNSARWNTPRVRSLEVKDGLLYVGGNFEGSQNVASSGVVAWDGRHWSAVGTGVQGGEVEDLETYRGELYAAGMISRDGMSYEGLLRWNGSTWSSMGLENCQVLALGLYGNKLVVGGNAGTDRFVPGSIGIVSWDGQRWGGFGTGMNGSVRAMRQMGGDLFVAGSFSYAGDQPSFGIARWGGAEPASPPDPGPSPPVRVPASLAVSSALVTSDRATVSYSLPLAGPVRLELFNARGARVATLLDQVSDAGARVLDWSAGSPAPFPQNGVYFLRLTADGRTANAKLVFAR